MRPDEERSAVAALLAHAQDNINHLSGDSVTQLAGAMTDMSSEDADGGLCLKIDDLTLAQVRELRDLLDAIAEENGQHWEVD